MHQRDFLIWVLVVVVVLFFVRGNIWMSCNEHMHNERRYGGGMPYGAKRNADDLPMFNV